MAGACPRSSCVSHLWTWLKNSKSRVGAESAPLHVKIALCPNRMKIQKAVITAASPHQRILPLQTLIDRDGEEKTLLRILLDEVRSADVHEICVVIAPGDEEAYARAA